ncbi:farnesol dehydrogenase-like [Megachile rotundata]|uniref:farnesol dehydrogenase-like n=1 Tax=Megachile rotundata TaxID=143995 RepID=UPI003FD5E965
MYRWHRKIAVVTGASSGIGLAIAKSFLQKGMTVIGLARRKQEMEMHMEHEDQKKNFHALKCDVTKELEVIDAFAKIKSDFGTVQVLVNNAGLVTAGTLIETSRSDWELIMNTNVMGLMECTKQAVLAMMEANVEGHIINMNSIQGLQVYNTRYNMYAPSKHAVSAITKTLRKEIGDKIRVTSINPGITDTALVRELLPHYRKPILLPEDVADAVVYIVGTPQNVHITDLTITPLKETRN